MLDIPSQSSCFFNNFLIFLKSSSVRILSISKGIDLSQFKSQTPRILLETFQVFSFSSYQIWRVSFPLYFFYNKLALYYLTQLMTDLAARETFLFLYQQQVQRQSIISSLIMEGNFLKTSLKVFKPMVIVNQEHLSLTKCSMICLTIVSIQSQGTKRWTLSAKAVKTLWTSFCLGSRYLMSDRQKGRMISSCLQVTLAMSDMQISLWSYFSFLALMMLKSFQAKTWGLQMRSIGMKFMFRDYIYRFLNLLSALLFYFWSCFSLYLVCLTIPF